MCVSEFWILSCKRKSELKPCYNFTFLRIIRECIWYIFSGIFYYWTHSSWNGLTKHILQNQRTCLILIWGVFMPNLETFRSCHFLLLALILLVTFRAYTLFILLSFIIYLYGQWAHESGKGMWLRAKNGTAGLELIWKLSVAIYLSLEPWAKEGCSLCWTSVICSWPLDILGESANQRLFPIILHRRNHNVMCQYATPQPNQFSRTEVGKIWPLGLLPAFVNKVLSEHDTR